MSIEKRVETKEAPNPIYQPSPAKQPVESSYVVGNKGNLSVTSYKKSYPCEDWYESRDGSEF